MSAPSFPPRRSAHRLVPACLLFLHVRSRTSALVGAQERAARPKRGQRATSESRAAPSPSASASPRARDPAAPARQTHGQASSRQPTSLYHMVWCVAINVHGLGRERPRTDGATTRAVCCVCARYAFLRAWITPYEHRPVPDAHALCVNRANVLVHSVRRCAVLPMARRRAREPAVPSVRRHRCVESVCAGSGRVGESSARARSRVRSHMFRNGHGAPYAICDNRRGASS